MLEVEGAEASCLEKVLANKAEPRIRSRLTMMEPRMEACTIRMWLLTSATLRC